MKLNLLLAFAILGCSSARAQTVQDDVAALEKKRAAEVARATDSVNRPYISEYERLLQRANLVGDASGANLVRAMIHRLNPEPEPSSASAMPSSDKKPSADPETVLTSNHWFDELLGENGRRHFFPTEFLPGGVVIDKKRNGKGEWKIAGNELVLEFTGSTEKFPLPVRTNKWPGRGSDGTPRFLEIDKSGGEAVAPFASQSGKPASSSASPADYFGKPNP